MEKTFQLPQTEIKIDLFRPPSINYRARFGGMAEPIGYGSSIEYAIGDLIAKWNEQQKSE